MKKRATSPNGLLSYRIAIQEQFTSLRSLRLKADSTRFYNAMLRILPQLHNYIKAKLQEAVHQDKLLHNFYSEEDFIDDLFISVYNNFLVLKNEEDFYLFLFQEIDTLLDKVCETEKKHHENMESLASYRKQELDGMRERFIAQLDGDLVMREEMDEISFTPAIENIKSFLQAEIGNTIDQKIDEELAISFKKEHLEELLSGLDQPSRDIANLYIHFHLTPPEIVKVVKKSKEEVLKTILTIRNYLKSALINA